MDQDSSSSLTLLRSVGELMACSLLGAALDERKGFVTCQLVAGHWVQHIPPLCICREKWIMCRVCSTNM